MKKFLVVVFLIFAVGSSFYLFRSPEEIIHQPGVLVYDDPIQKNISEPKTWEKNEFNFRALTEFHIKARVLSLTYYSSGKEGKISPVDFALGWGQMSDQAVLDRIKITQRNRWYFWKTDAYPIPHKEIISSSANMHILPASDKVEKLLDDVYKGSIVEIKGYLVEVRDKSGWRWKSSLSRDDTGDGSCEVVWVEELKILSDK